MSLPIFSPDIFSKHRAFWKECTKSFIIRFNLLGMITQDRLSWFIVVAFALSVISGVLGVYESTIADIL